MQVELTSEDRLRLNVLAVSAEAIRINENSLEVFGLKDGREMKAQLHPAGNSDRYLKKVRELLATLALDSPGGYPVFLQRWTRMGQVDHQRLASLLKLAEPEAVMAVVCSPSLTHQLAQLAWWCEPQAENARRMLQQPKVAQGTLGPELAAFLVEHLPFETEPEQMLETVRLVLQPGLIDAEMRQRLWKRGRSSRSYRVGFLQAQAEQLPDPLPEHPGLAACRPRIEVLSAHGNAPARQLLKLLQSNGQTFTASVIDAMRRPANQDVVAALFTAMSAYYGSLRSHHGELREIDSIETVVQGLLSEQSPALRALLAEVPELAREIEAMLFLAHLDDTVLTPILSMTDAIGSVMRKRLEPVSTPLLERLNCLLGQPT